MTADIIIPTYRPGDKFSVLLERLIRQTVKPNRIIIMNTDEAAWDRSGMGSKLLSAGAFDLCEIHHLDKAKFDHGHTRNMGVSFSHAPYFICMTQDAVPKDDQLIEGLLNPMNENVKMTYARQLPDRDAKPMERFSRYFNYSGSSLTKTEKDLPELGIKTYFASNVCAAYERKTFDELGGFTDRTVFNEDMIYTAGLLKSGKAVRYCADAVVYHSHNYTAGRQFQRNFDLGVSQADHPEIFSGIKSESEGIRLVRTTADWLKKQGCEKEIPNLYRVSAFKYLGYKTGIHYRMLPRFLAKKISMNKAYWEKKI